MMVVRNLFGQAKRVPEPDPESESLLSHASHTEHHMSHPRVISDVILVFIPAASFRVYPSNMILLGPLIRSVQIPRICPCVCDTSICFLGSD